jgi:DNA-binding CsgD family transcriptional regulator
MSSSSHSPNGGNSGYDFDSLEYQFSHAEPKFVQHLLAHDLTPAQRDVCYLTRKLSTVKDIAAIRRSSTKTIEKHRHDAHRKLNAPAKQNFRDYLAILAVKLRGS